MSVSEKKPRRRRNVASQGFIRDRSTVDETGCWLWNKSIDSHGYGTSWNDGKTCLAHRLSWIVFNGPIENGLHVLHVCDVRSCVNPEHLFLGTNKDNIYDCMSKGRRAIRCKLTDDQVSDIVDRYSHGESASSLSKAFGVTSVWIHRIGRQLERTANIG